jgi:5-methylcytosine-specific restriction protein A
MPERPPRFRSAQAGEYEKSRASARASGYDARWQKARRAFLDANPLCVSCMAQGRRVRASAVDHITPHRGDAATFWDVSNWQALCQSCHSRKTATEGRRYYGDDPTRGALRRSER